jgi:hypothetical protein
MCLNVSIDSHNLYAGSLEDEEILGGFVKGFTKARRTISQTNTVVRKNKAHADSEDASRANEFFESLKMSQDSKDTGRQTKQFSAKLSSLHWQGPYMGVLLRTQ